MLRKRWDELSEEELEEQFLICSKIPAIKHSKKVTDEAISFMHSQTDRVIDLSQRISKALKCLEAGDVDGAKNSLKP